MGAVGALALALVRRRLSLEVLRGALATTTTLSTFVMFILIGSTVFGLIFRAVNGDLWVEHLFGLVPGGRSVSCWWSACWCSCSAASSTSSRSPSSCCRCSPRWRTSWASTWCGSGAGRHEHADLLPDPALRFRALLPAQRGPGRQLPGRLERQKDRGHRHHADLPRRDSLHRPADRRTGHHGSVSAMVTAPLGRSER